MKVVLVTGANGQLGKCLQELKYNYSDIEWIFKNSEELDITNNLRIEEVFNLNKIDFCINCAAYTNVEKAESDEKKAYAINADAVRDLAQVCSRNNATLIHISTDYVFDGEARKPYQETDATNPINVYGASKLKGEEYVREFLHQHIILRTSWLYSQFGHNFYKTILKKAEEGATLNITTAQRGTPTNANDLANFIAHLIDRDPKVYGTFHFNNLGDATWFDFAKEILFISHNLKAVELNQDNSYQTIAKRPSYSVMDNSKLVSSFKFTPMLWSDSLKKLYNFEKNKI